MKIAVLDIGASHIKSGIITTNSARWADITLVEKKETPSNARLGGPRLMETAKNIIAEYARFDSIGISTAGQVDSGQGIIRFANQNIPDYTGTKIKEIFEETFNVPVAVENDVNAAALGESIFGIGKGAKEKTFLCLTYGGGIGGAIVIDGKIYKGASFSAGEFGYIITHGKKASFYEEYASTPALVRNIHALHPELDNGRKIFLNLDKPEIKEIIDNWIEEILYGLSSLIHIFNPSLVILGGGVMEQDYIIESLRKKINQYIMPGFGDVILAPAVLGNDAGLWGVGHLASFFFQRE